MIVNNKLFMDYIDRGFSYQISPEFVQLWRIDSLHDTCKL